MKRWMIVACLVVFASACRVNAQQNIDTGDNELKSPKRVRVGGALGFIPSLALFKNDEINKTLKKIGMPQLSSDPMVLVGGEGYGYIMFVPNLRIGGFGTGGYQDVTMIDAANIKKNVEYHVSYGGFLMDYVVPVTQHFDIAGGFTIGAGTVEIVMTRDDGSFKKWENITTDFGTNIPATNVTQTLTGSFVAFNPHVNLEYTILPWVQLRVGVGYPIFFSSAWELNKRDEIQNVPSNLKPDGVTINGGIMVGLFN